MARIVRDDDAGRTHAASILRDGGVVAIPTDTVYGLAVALDTPGGIERLFRVKQRQPDHAITLLLADTAQAGELGLMAPAAVALGNACWPGGLTLVVAQRPDVPLPEVLTGNRPTIGLRVPDHAAPRSLAREVGPIPVTSANVSGHPEAHDAAEILALLGDRIELILDGGPAHGGPASTVIDCTAARPRALRPGTIALERLAAILDGAGIAHDLGA